MRSIIDSHQHFWKLGRGDYDWLSASLDTLYRDFQPGDLEGELRQHGVEKTIVVQAAATVAETRYLLELAERTDFITGVVGWVPLDEPDAVPLLTELAANDYFVGIRPMLQDIEASDWILRDECQDGLAAAIDFELAFDALITPRHLEITDTFAARYPGLRIVVDHCAKPAFEQAEFPAWRDAMRRLAGHDNVWCKLSGLLTEAPAGSGIDALKPYVDVLLDAFGDHRLLWGSDWPVLHLAADYGTWFDYTQQLLASIGDDSRQRILCDNARQFYRLPANRS